MTTLVHRKNEAVDAFGVPPLVEYKRRSELTEELCRWYALDGAARHDELKRAVAHEKRWRAR